MIKAYLAGPYSATTEALIKLNIHRAASYSLKLWEAGFAVLCPHLNTSGFHGYENGHTITRETWINGDLEWLQCADVVFVLPNSEQSKGTRAEIEFAKFNGIKIYHLPPISDSNFTAFIEQVKNEVGK